MGIEYLNKVKKERGLTAKELSNLSGVPLSTLNKILSGQTTDPKFETLKAICNALGISLAELDSFETKKDELTSYLDELRYRPEMKMLFKTARHASKENIEKFTKMIEIFNEDNADGE